MSTLTKRSPHDILHRLRPDEPFFTLAARDEAAPAQVERWAADREREIQEGIRPDTPHERAQIMEAQQCAQSMRMWRIMNWPRVENDE